MIAFAEAHNSPFAKLLGIRYISVEQERLVAEMTVRDELCTTPAIAHGGALMAFADTLGAVGTFVNLSEGKRTTTIESSTKFIGGAKAGSVVMCECTALVPSNPTSMTRSPAACSAAIPCASRRCTGRC